MVLYNPIAGAGQAAAAAESLESPLRQAGHDLDTGGCLSPNLLSNLVNAPFTLGFVWNVLNLTGLHVYE